MKEDSENFLEFCQKPKKLDDFFDTVSHFSVNTEKTNSKSHEEPVATKISYNFPRKRRTSIASRPNKNVSIDFLKETFKNINGKDLFKIPIPCNFNEPLSGIQRLSEEMEYSYFLDTAAECSDSIEQMKNVAAFMISSYGSYTNRTFKPFNPLLGETFENDRYEDYGWRSISEQVSHYPPVSAMVVFEESFILILNANY